MNTFSPEDANILRQMYRAEAAKEASDADGVTVLRTALGNEYRFPLSMREPFAENLEVQAQQAVDTLMQNNDTRVLYLLHVWKTGHCLDLPPYGLRKALSKLHPENQNALLPLQGEEAWIVKTIASTF